MTLVSRIRIYFLIFIILSTGSSMLAAWSIQKSNYHIQRLTLSHQVLDDFLLIESHTYQLFKQFGDALLIGNRDVSAETRLLSHSIQQDIARARAAIRAEMKFLQARQNDEHTELEKLAEIETRVNHLTASLEALAERRVRGNLRTNWSEVSRILNTDIDLGFRQLIRDVIDGESAEVLRAREAAHRQVQFQQTLVVLCALTALGTAIYGAHRFKRLITEPVERLAEGVRRFAEGDIHARIELKGRDEISSLGAEFDVMAERLAEQTHSLEQQKMTLTRVVDQRTEQLEQLFRELKRSEEARKQMIADVSHELRTPLTIIKGEADVALRSRDTGAAPYREALERTRDAASHTARLVDDLLLVARAESGELALKEEVIDLGAIVDEVTRYFGRDITVVKEIEPAPMIGDPGRLRQVLLILLQNARNHGGHAVRVRLAEFHHGYRLQVEDDGPGMTDDEKQFAFMRFFRGSNAAERYSEGAGLGLPVAQSIVHAHCGQITLGDAPGGGLLVDITLPFGPKPEFLA